jgi:FtsP/CotA-like multicopper oxidase with cupredoxin domain
MARKPVHSSNTAKHSSGGMANPAQNNFSQNMGGGVQNACYVYPGAPATPGITNPNVVFNRGIYMDGTITMDDGKVVTVWGFTDDADNGMGGGGNGMGNNRPFPSPTMRLTEGQIAHTRLNVMDCMCLHTIHHHGIEPSWQNDGVGHISWDVDGIYTYQWRPQQAGSYFYHCHTNTVLHAEMGMYGALIVDPVPNPNDLTGTKRVFGGGPTYDVEVVWVCDDIDSSWHTLDWAAGTCGQDEGFNELEPDYFIITGVDGANSALTAPGVAVQMTANRTLLARYINAGYLPQRIHFGGLRATVVASDGRPLPRAFRASSLYATSAERYDLLFAPTRAGEYDIVVEFLHWQTEKVIGTARTRITVA